MRLAIIDLGTNSVRFDLHEVGQDDEIYHLHREKLMIRLGEGVFLKGKLNPRSADLCIAAFKSFAKTIALFRVQKVLAFGTSALREARDGEKLIRKLKRETGIHVRIISGEEEARLIARGILANETNLRGKFALVDIGGGSTEVTVCAGQKILNSASFPLGTARLQQVFLKTIPPQIERKSKKSPVENLRRHIRGILLYRVVSEDWPKAPRIYASSGTARTLSRVIKRLHGDDVVSLSKLRDLVNRMKGKTRKELMAIPGMEARRVDMILAGAILMEECMSALKAREMLATEFSLRDGILIDQLDWLSKHPQELRYSPVTELFISAKDLGVSEAELRQTLRTAERIFDLFKPVHRLAENWKLYLLSAAVIRTTGHQISPIASEYHAGYIARNVDIPAFEDWESKLIADLCVFEPVVKLVPSELPFKKDKSKQKVFLKLLSMLRIATGLSFQRSDAVVLDKLQIKGKRLRLCVGRRNSPEISILRADQRKGLFEELFKKEVSIEVGA